MTRKRTVAVALFLVACAAVGSVWWLRNGPGPELVVPDTHYGMQMDDVRPHVPYAFDDVPVCLNEAGSVTVTGVEIANPHGGLSLRRWSVQDSPESGSMSYLVDQRTTLDAEGYPANGPFVVDHLCFDNRPEESEEPISLVGFEVERSDSAVDEPAYGTGLVIHYRSGGRDESAFVGFSVVLCPGNVDRRPDCDVHEVRPPG